MNRIESLLKEKGIRKVRLAEMLNTNKQNVNAMFRNPTLNTLEKIAKALEVPVWQLLVPPEEILGEASEIIDRKNEIVCPHCGKPLRINIS